MMIVVIEVFLLLKIHRAGDGVDDSLSRGIELRLLDRVVLQFALQLLLEGLQLLDGVLELVLFVLLKDLADLLKAVDQRALLVTRQRRVVDVLDEVFHQVAGGDHFEVDIGPAEALAIVNHERDVVLSDGETVGRQRFDGEREDAAISEPRIRQRVAICIR